MELTAVLTATEEGGHVALNPETATTSQGEAVEGAIASLTEPTALYLSETPLPVPGPSLLAMFSVPVHA
jgi:predicted RNase H-like HicB family nuclease